MKMKPILSIFFTLLVVITCEPQASKRALLYNHWPAMTAKQTHARDTLPKTKTLMVQIRSDHPVPLVFKGRPGPTHTHGHFVQIPIAASHAHSHIGGLQRRPRPIKLSAPVYLKGAPMKQIMRQPLKIKLSNVKTQSKPIAANYEKPYKYEKPASASYLDLDLASQLPSTTKANFISEHFAPIHTIPAPNLALHDNHIHHEEAHVSKPQSYKPTTTTTASSYKNTNNHHNNIENQYQVLEEITNDATFVDPLSDSQKFFAPDPDPSLPTSKMRPALETYNQPSNGKPLPVDVQNNQLIPVQPIVQIVGAQQAKLTAADVYQNSLHLAAQQAQLQPFLSEHITAIQAAPIPNYNPTYLVTQSNNLYSQHKQQLFQPHIAHVSPSSIVAGYANADLTQEVASDGQILQAAKHAHHPDYEPLPQFAALIAAPALSAQQTPDQLASFHLPNVAAPSDPQGGFVVSDYYSSGAAQDSSQLLQAYEEEESRREQAENELATLELQKQHLQQQHHQQQQQQQLQQLQQIHEAAHLQNHIQQQQPVEQLDPAASAFEEHQRLVQQHLGNTPLRIFVPDEEEARLRKRSEQQTSMAEEIEESENISE